MGLQEFRPLNNTEEQLVESLLEKDFPGRDMLVNQISTSLVREVDADGSLSFETRTKTKADVTKRIPVEGEFEDLDGVVIHVLLHVVDGYVKELEIYKEDGSGVIKMPDPSKLKVLGFD